jgi:hypothetical protein
MMHSAIHIKKSESISYWNELLQASSGGHIPRSDSVHQSADKAQIFKPFVSFQKSNPLRFDIVTGKAVPDVLKDCSSFILKGLKVKNFRHTR